MISVILIVTLKADQWDYSHAAEMGAEDIVKKGFKVTFDSVRGWDKIWTGDFSAHSLSYSS